MDVHHGQVPGVGIAGTQSSGLEQVIPARLTLHQGKGASKPEHIQQIIVLFRKIQQLLIFFGISADDYLSAACKSEMSPNAKEQELPHARVGVVAQKVP